MMEVCQHVSDAVQGEGADVPASRNHILQLYRWGGKKLQWNSASCSHSLPTYFIR